MRTKKAKIPQNVKTQLNKTSEQMPFELVTLRVYKSKVFSKKCLKNSKKKTTELLFVSTKSFSL